MRASSKKHERGVVCFGTVTKGRDTRMLGEGVDNRGGRISNGKQIRGIRSERRAVEKRKEVTTAGRV